MKLNSAGVSDGIVLKLYEIRSEWTIVRENHIESCDLLPPEALLSTVIDAQELQFTDRPLQNRALLITDFHVYCFFK